MPEPSPAEQVDLVEPEDPAAWALARHIADHPVRTVQAAFRYLNAPLTIELHEVAPAPTPAPVPECAASISGNCLAEDEGYTGCATEDGECIHEPAPGPADVREQIVKAVSRVLLDSAGRLVPKHIAETARAVQDTADAVLRVPMLQQLLTTQRARTTHDRDPQDHR